MIWPEGSHLHEVLDQISLESEPTLVGEVVIEELGNGQPLTEEALGMIALNCEFEKDIVAAEVVCKPDSGSGEREFVLSFIASTPDERVALSEIMDAGLDEMIRAGVDHEYVLLERGHTVEVTQLLYDQSVLPELELDISSERYDNPDARPIFGDIVEEYADAA